MEDFVLTESNIRINNLTKQHFNNGIGLQQLEGRVRSIEFENIFRHVTRILLILTPTLEHRYLRSELSAYKLQLQIAREKQDVIWRRDCREKILFPYVVFEVREYQFYHSLSHSCVIIVLSHITQMLRNTEHSLEHRYGYDTVGHDEPPVGSAVVVAKQLALFM